MESKNCCVEMDFVKDGNVIKTISQKKYELKTIKITNKRCGAKNTM